MSEITLGATIGRPLITGLQWDSPVRGNVCEADKRVWRPLQGSPYESLFPRHSTQRVRADVAEGIIKGNGHL